MKKYEFYVDVEIDDDQGGYLVGKKIIIDEDTIRQLVDAVEECIEEFPED